jgi:peptide/nickel transport system permease protein
VLLLLTAAVGAPYIAPYDPFDSNVIDQNMPPVWSAGGTTQHPLGTDQLGRDLTSRLLYGARTSLTIAGGAALLAAAFGSAVGLVAGYFRGRVETALMRLVDVQLAFPFILLALAILAVVESRSLLTMTIVLAIAGWVIHARVTRGRVLVEREREYVRAAKALGASHARIMLLYILPVVLPTILVILLLEIAALMVAESVLAFVGLGIQPPGISWGTILADGRTNLIVAPWMAVLPGIAIFVSVLGVNLVADGLADVLDPRFRGRKATPRPRSARRGGMVNSDTEHGREGPSGSTAAPDEGALLSISGLRVEFSQEEDTMVAVKDVSFVVRPGERLGIVGESGSGKSVTGLSVMGLLDPPGRVTRGSIVFKGQDLLRLSSRERNKVRGAKIAMIFQDPSSSLNPTLTVGYQVAEVISRHQGVRGGEARRRTTEALGLVNINDPERVARSYPFQLSGGMQQRVMIATALSCNPDLLIADEPTTALDVTTQAQILDELNDLVSRLNTGIILVTHDLGVVAEFTDRTVVMQDGFVRESGPTAGIIESPKHPYTRSLLRAVMELEEPEKPAGGARAARP